jgi:hypothetical protein
MFLLMRDHVRKLLLKRMPSCQAAAVLISASLDRELALPERILLRAHLHFCRICARYRQHLVFLRNVIGQRAKRNEEETASALTSPAPLDPQARARLKRALARKQH